METVGINGTSRIGTTDFDQASFTPSNNNQGVSPDFISAMTQFGQEQIDSGLAPANANPFDIVLAGIAQNLTIVVNINSFDFEFGPE